ncbi:unnamed protein product [Bursaphelenchus xylophilus]|uniref:(pine wood nematode) hypothetical protein n=1 Tax=Bursaphelenchus xylophilus TaxID=6326 RepID=A0A1I7RUI0_BURXY|nr:unnamed protein product [Bursaphelenchus xylophilus]CAG9114143.1 unnamed protein product [Bursaphelenchus xylophilus]
MLDSPSNTGSAREDTESVSSDSVKDRIARFESLKETAKFPIHRTVESELIEEEAREHSGQRKEEEHVSQRPTELSIQRTAEGKETEAERLNETPMESPSTPQVVTEQREQIGRALTVESPPKSDTQELAEPSPATTEEPQVSVHKLVQKFSQPSEGTTDTSSAAQFPEHHVVAGDGVSRVDSREQIIVREEVEVEPSASTIPETEQHKDLEDIAQTVHKLSVEQHESVQVQPGFGDDIVNVSVQEKIRRLEPATSLESEHDEEGFERQVPEHQAEIGDHDEGLAKAEVEEEVQVRTKPPSDEEFARINQARQEASEEPTEIAGERKTLPIHRALDEEVQDAETGELGEKETPESHLEAAQTPDLSTSTSSSVQQLGAGKSETSEVQPEVISEQQRIRISRTAEQGVVEEDEGEKAGRNVEESHIKPDEEEHSYGKAAAAAALAAAGGFAAAVASSLHDDKEYESRSPTEHTVPSDAPSESDKSPVSPSEREVAAEQSGRTGDRCEEDLLAQTPSESSEDHFTAEGPRSTRSIPIHHTAQGEVVEGQISETHGFKGPELSPHEEEYDTERAHKTESEAVDQTKAHEPAEALATPSDSARSQEPSPIDVSTPESAQEKALESEPLSPRGASPHQAEEELEKEILKREIEPVGDLEKELGTTETVEPVGTEKEISPDESTRQFLDQPSELEAEDVRKAVAHEQEVQQQHEQTPEEEDKAKRKESSPDESTRKFLDQPSELEAEDVREATRHEQEAQQHEQTPEEEDEAKKMGLGTMIAGAALLGGKALYDKLKGDKDQGEGYDGHDSGDDQKPEGGAGKIVSESYEYSYTDDGSGKPKEEFEHHIVAQDDQGRLVEEVEHREPEVEYRSVGDSAEQSPASVRKQVVQTPESQGEVSEAEPSSQPQAEAPSPVAEQLETPEKPLEISSSAASISEEGPKSPPATPTKVVHVHEHYHEQITDKDGNLVDDVTFESNYDTREPSETSQRQSPLLDERKVSLAAVGHDVKAEPVSHFEEQTIHIDPSVLPPSGTQTFHEERVETTEDLRRKSIKEDLDIHVVPKDDQHYQMHIHEERVEREDDQPEKVLIERDYDIEAPSGTEITLPEADQPVENIREEVKEGFVSGQPESDVTESHYKVHEERHEQVLDADGHVIKDTTVVKDYDDENPEPIEEVHEAEKEFVSELERRLSAASSARGDTQPAEQQQEAVEIAETPVSEKEFTAEGPRSTKDIDVYSAESTGLASPEAQKTSEFQQKSGAGSTEGSIALAQDTGEARDREFLEELEQEQKEHEQHQREVAEEQKQTVKSETEPVGDLEKELRVTESVEPVGRVSISKREIEPVGDLEKELRTTESVEPVGTGKEISPDESTRQFLDQPSELEAEDVRQAVAHEQEAQQPHKHAHEESEAKRKESSPDESARKFLDQPSELETEDVREATRHEQEVQQHEQTPEEEDQAKKMGIGTMIAGAALLGGKALYDKLKGDKDQGEGYDGHDSDDDQKPEGGAGKIVSESYEYSYTDDGSGKPKEEFEHHIVAQDDHGRLVEEVEHEPEVEYRSVGDSAKQSPASVRKQIVETPESQGEVSEAEPARKVSEDLHFEATQQKETPDFEVAQVEEPTTTSDTIVESQGNYDIAGGALESPQAPAEISEPSPAGGISAESVVHGTPETPEHHVEKHGEDGEKLPERFSPTEDDIRVSPSQETPQEHRHVVTKDTYEYSYTSDGEHQPHTEVTHITSTQKDDGPVVEHEKHYDIPGDAVQSPGEPVVLERKYSVEHFDEPSSHSADKQDVAGSPEQTSSPFEVIDQPSPVSDQIHHEPHHTVMTDSYEYSYTSDGVHEPHVEVTHKTITQEDEGPVVEHEEHYDLSGKESIGSPNKPLESPAVQEIPQSARSEDLSRKSDTYSVQTGEAEPESEYQVEEIPEDQSLKSDFSPEALQKQESPRDGHEKVIGHHFGSTEELPQTVEELERRERHPSPLPEESEIPDRPAVPTEASVEVIGTPAEEQDFTAEGPRSRRDIDVYGAESSGIESAEAQKTSDLQRTEGEERHRGYEPIAQDEESPEGEDQGDKAKKMGLGTMIAGAAYLGGKAIYDKLKGDKQGYEQVPAEDFEPTEGDTVESYRHVGDSAKTSPELTRKEHRTVHEFDDDFERPAVDEHALRDKLDKEADEKQRQGVQEVPETQGSQEFIEGLPAPPEEPKETVYIHEERHETVIGPDGHVLKDIIETRDYDTAHPEVYETRKTSIGEEERRTSYSDASREIEISPEDLPTTEEPKEVHVHEQHTEWSQDEFGHPREVEIVEDFDITEKTSDDHVPVQGEHEIHVHEKRVEHVVGFGGEDREITTTREYDLHVPEGAEEVHLPDASEPIDQVIASGDEPVHYHVHEERDEKVLDKEGHVLSDVKYVKDFDDEHPEDNVYELKSAEIRGESRLPGDEHQVRQAEEGQLGDVQESSEELENISNASVKDLDIGDGHPYHEARTADVFEQQPIEGLTITERVPINRSPASDIVESEAMSTEHLDISQQPIRENVDAQEVEEGQKIGPATMLAGAAAYGAMKLAEKLRGTGDEQAEEEEYPEAYRRRSETSPVGDIDKETAPSEDPTHQAEPVGSYDESSPCQSTKDYVTRDLEDYELAALQSQEQASPVDEQHEQHVTEPSESQRKTDIEEKEESEQKLVDEIDNEPVELVDDRPYHSSTEEIRPRPHDLGIDAQDNLDLQSPVSIATVRREDTDENLDIMQESIYIPADTPQSESRTPKTDYSYDIEQTPEFASEKYEGHDEEKDPMQQSIYIHHDEEGDQQQAYEEGERSGRDVMEQSVHELYDQRKPPSELVESESIEQEEEYYPDEQHHRSEDIHSETTPVGDLDRETHVSGDIQLETEPVGDVEQQTTPSAPSWKEAEPVGNIAKEVATSVDARQEAEPVVSHQELEGDLEDVVDTESIEGVDKKQEKVGKEEKKSEEDDQEVVESESIDEEKAQKIGLGTMIAGAAYLGGKALYDKLKGDKKEGEDTIDSSEIVESPEDLQSPLRKDSKDEFERKSEISRESSQVLSSDSQITALHVSETDGLVESESLDVETPEEMGSLSPKRRSFEEDKEPLVRSETVEHEAPELPETPTPAKREVEWPKKTAEEEQRQLPTAPSETPSEAEGELVESESIDHPSAEGLESPKSSRFEESGGLVHSETIDESTVLQDTPTSPIHKEPISPEKVGEAFGVHELKEEEGHFEPDVHSPDLVESEEIQHHLQEHHDLPKVLDYTVPRDQEGHPEETGGEVELHEPAPSHKEPISPGKVGEAFGVHELKEEEERFEPNAHSPELVESEEIQHHLQEHHDLPKVIDFTVPRDQEGHPQEGFGSETDTHEVDRQALVESESIDLGAEEPPASPKLSPQKTPVDIISPDEEPSVEEKIRFLKEDEEPETTTGTTEYQDQFRRIDEEHLVESEGIEQSESQPGQITSEKEYLAQKQDSEEDLESPEAYERPVVSAEDQEHHGLVESESIEHPEEPSSVMSESVYEKESPTKESPTKQEAVESKDTRRSFDGTPTTPIRKQSDLILSLDTLQQDIQRQFSQESAGGHELVQPVQEHEEPKIESPKDKKDEFGLTEEEQVEMSALAKAIITSDVPEDIRVKDEPKHDEKVEYEGEDVVESAHIHTLPDEHHFEPSGDIHFIHREEHREGLGSHEQLVESQEAAQGGLEGQQTHKDELSKSVTSAEQRESPQAAEEPYDFDDVEIVESTDLDFEKHDESARQPAEEIYHEEEEEQHEAESPKRQEEDDFDIIQHDDIIDIQMTEEEIAKSEAIRAKDAKAHSFSPRLRGAESPTSTPLQDSELGLGVEESELTHKLEDLERPDLRKVRDIEFERTDSAGSILKDRELTKEDFGGHMPDLSKDSESEDEKPTVERFDQGVEIKIESELDEKHVDFDLVEKEGALAPAEPIGRPQSPIPPRTQSVEQSEASPAGTSKTPESTRAIESVAEEEVGYDGQLEADQNEEAYDLAAKKMEADAKAEISPSNDSGSSNASSTVFVRKEINPDVKMKDSDDGSQSSLLEFERLEQEVVGKQTSPGQSDNEQMVASATGSVNSLLEFENIEREVLEDQINQEAIGQAIGPEVMILSDIREESEVEEMSIKGDDEDSLNEAQIIAEAMITSADSLEPSGGMPVLNRMETSIDSLEPQFSGSRQHHDDSLLDEGTSGVQSQDTQAGMSADTAGTFQEYHDDDRDSLDGALDDYETITTFQTTQEKPDGTTETIIRKVRTRTNDPVHSHVRFTGTESEDRLRNIEPEQEIESVDEEGNITKTIRRTLH